LGVILRGERCASACESRHAGGREDELGSCHARSFVDASKNGL
jgi:hypothetical protein